MSDQTFEASRTAVDPRLYAPRRPAATNRPGATGSTWNCMGDGAETPEQDAAGKQYGG